jgi:hypothetical protein
MGVAVFASIATWGLAKYALRVDFKEGKKKDED